MALLACQAPPEGTVEDHRRGVVQHWAGTEAVQARLVVEMTIASDSEGAAAFGRVRDIASDLQGRIVVAEGYGNELRVFTGGGTFLEALGREGQGPGEFAFLSGLAVAPDGTVWAMDPGNQRITGFTADEVRTLPVPGEGWSATVPWLGLFSKEGDLIDLAIESDGRGGTLKRVERWSIDGDSLVLQHRLDLPVYAPDSYQLERGQVTETRAVPFAPERRLALSPDGGVWVNDESPYVIHRLGADGDTLLTIRRSLRASQVSRSERARAASSAGLRTAQIPRERQVIERVVADLDGGVWVFAGERAPDGSAIADLWSEAGEWTRIVIPVALDSRVVPEVSGDRVAATVRDSLDRQSVIVGRVERR